MEMGVVGQFLRGLLARHDVDSFMQVQTVVFVLSLKVIGLREASEKT